MKGIWKFSQLFWKPEIISLKETTNVKEKGSRPKKKKKNLTAENQGLQPRVQVKSLTNPTERLCKQSV